MATTDLHVIDNPSLADIDFLDERIYEFNVERTGYDDGRKLAIFVRNDAGEIVAGLWGWTWGGYCEVRILWVHPSLRRQGLGGRLLLAAEEEARARKASYMMLGTHSFQGPDYYPRFGYRRIATIPGRPPGHEEIWFKKEI